MLEVGIRVIRGPDWQWGAQDDGNGHVGTVVEIGKSGSQISPDKTAVVGWDYGFRTNYRVGYEDCYDLRVVDNAPAGVKHPNIICDGCQKMGIAGMRWKCVQCYDYDLCTRCYMADTHDLNHRFQRFESANSCGVEMPPRSSSTRKVVLKGMFVGAKVVRGPDWDWGNQDGGDGRTGRIIDIRGWDSGSSRSVANVTWTSGSTNVYRVGHKGKVDLKYVEPAIGGTYYRDHLPLLGQQVEGPVSKIVASPQHLTFNVGDKVKVMMPVDTLRQMQEGHGGWNPRMAEYIGETGTVQRVTERGDIRVQYEGCSHRWTFHPGTLTKVNAFAVGDIVRVCSDIALVKCHQRGHGEWIEVMKKALGKMGKVTKIYADGDLRVCVDGQTWTLNPLCVQLLPGSATELNNTLQETDQVKGPTPVASLLLNLVDQHVDTNSINSLVHQAAQGNGTFVREFLSEFPHKVNEKSSGKTCLQVAAHQGHTELVWFLIAAGANLEVIDEVGDTALHYSAFGNQAEVMEMLLANGAKINAVNANKCTALHVAVSKQLPHLVRILLKNRCDVNLQDSYGDTALHDAIGKDNHEIVEALCNAPGVDFTLRNKRGFNVLHHAALKGNNFATQKLAARTRQLVDVKKDDGFSALHLASLNGHQQIAKTLLEEGQAFIDILNNRRQTPLMLAVSQGHCGVVELLTLKGSSPTETDEDGDTALHLAVMKMVSVPSAEVPVTHSQAPIISQIQKWIHSRNPELPSALAIVCFLIINHWNLMTANNKQKTPVDCIPASYPYLTEIFDLIKLSAKQRASNIMCLMSKIEGESSNVGATGTVMKSETVITTKEESRAVNVSGPPTPATKPEPQIECTVCSEVNQNICFEPCGHQVACEECAARMKRCLTCHETIVRQITKDGRVLTCKERQSSAERLKYLETKIAEIEETHFCSICMERRRNVAFLCGHGSCEPCSQTLKTCHMCRKTITKKINLY